MYKYKLTEDDNSNKFHQESIDAFANIENRLNDIRVSLRKAKIETIKYYRENPDSYAVVYGTDLISDYLNDIETLLQPEK